MESPPAAAAAREESPPIPAAEDLADRRLHAEDLAAHLERQLERIGQAQHVLKHLEAGRRLISARFVEVLRAEHPEGIVIRGVIYRAHKDGKGIDRSKAPSAAKGGVS